MSDKEKNENELNIQYKKPNFFKKVWFSVAKFEKYPEMAAEGVPSALKYLTKIMVIFALIISVAITVQLYQMVQKGVNYIEKELPDFSYKDGVLNVASQESITIEKTDIFGKIIIDTSEVQEEKENQYKNSIASEEQGIILLKDKMILKNLLATGEVTYNYKDMFNSSGASITEFKKQDIIDFARGQEMPSMYISFGIVILLYAFIMYIISTLMDTLILSILGYLTASIAKMKIKYAAIYNMSVYALTLSVLMNAIYIVLNMFTGFKITYFQVMYTSVAYIYLAAAIFIIKSEFIKKQAELMKIIQEQEKVKNEIQENELNEKKEENKDLRDEDEKNEDSKDNNDEGEEPEGSKA